MFLRRWRDDPDEWEEVSEEEVRSILGKYFDEPECLIREMMAGNTVCTSFEDFRWEPA